MKRLITSALPYVNNIPHLGNIIGCVLSADVFARYCRARGYDTLYVCGTDEYGTATENKAREDGMTPQQICDKYHAIHKAIYEQFDIAFDVFGRTSTPEQTEVAHAIFHDLDRRGYIVEQTSQRTFCDTCTMFLADRYVEGTCPYCGFEDARGDQCDHCSRLLDPEKLIDPRCKICSHAPSLRETSHLYLDLQRLQKPLTEWVDSASKEGAWTRNAIQTTQSWLDKGLSARPITRDLSWGIPVPKKGYEHKVFYVWFDAPIGYISITARQFPDWKDWWQNPEGVRLYQFMAKDNIPFHTVMFPATLIGSGRTWTLLHHINSTEYLNYEETKFSKSRGIGVFGTDAAKTGIPADLWRFYLLAIRPEKNDSSFMWHEFFEKVNSEFIDNIGNLVNRTLVYLNKNFEGVIGDDFSRPPHAAFLRTAQKAVDEITESMEAVRLRESLRLILALGKAANKFFQDMVPWEYIKTDRAHAHATVSLLAYSVRCLATMIAPFMPKTADRIFAMLGISTPHWSAGTRFEGMDGHRIGKTEILFKKMDMDEAETLRKQFGAKNSKAKGLTIVVGRVTHVAKHPKADRLYLLTVDLGEATQRQLVAGLVEHFSPDQLANRKVLVLANLQPSKIRGVESQGMVLACQDGHSLDLFDLAACPVGAKVTHAHQTRDSGTLSIDEFRELDLRVRDHHFVIANEPCRVVDEPVKSATLRHGKIC